MKIIGLCVIDQTPRPKGVSEKRWRASRQEVVIPASLLNQDLVMRLEQKPVLGTHLLVPMGDDKCLKFAIDSLETKQ